MIHAYYENGKTTVCYEVLPERHIGQTHVPEKNYTGMPYGVVVFAEKSETL